MLDRNYRTILRKILAERVGANPRYSMRAFAKSLDLAPARLSLVLAGKQGLSRTSALAISNKLELAAREKEFFIASAIATDGRSRSERVRAQGVLQTLATGPAAQVALEEHEFALIADWQHFAVLELMQTKGFRGDPTWIARRLGLTKFEVTQTLARLEELGYIAREDSGIRLIKSDVTTTKDVPSEAIRKFNRQILDKAKTAITMQSVLERDVSTLTVGIRKRDLPKYKELIKNFRREFNAIATATPSSARDEVYVLSAQFFKLTEGKST